MTEATNTETGTDKPKKAPFQKKEPTPPPVPTQAQPTPLADREISQKRLEKLNETLKACMDDFEAILKSAPGKGVAALAGKGALPQDVPENYKAVSLAVDVIKGRRVSQTLFSTRLKNLLIQQYAPMQLGSWLLFDKK
jgi:hypothetical protein